MAPVATSIALDIIALTFPLPVLFRLHINTKRKVGIALIFWLGAFRGFHGSNGNRSQRRSKSGLTGPPRKADFTNESQVELAQASEDWVTTDVPNIVNAEHVSGGTDEERTGYQGQGIFMTKGVHVART
ncbi:MAG: hypothetical protein Q9188_003598 [Gyalolechia gomerana]